MTQFILTISSLIIATLLIFSLAKKEKSEGLKLFLFWGMVIPIIFTTFYLTAVTIAKNQRSATGGPVHWHADYEIFVCGNSEQTENASVKGTTKTLAHEGEEINLKDPKGLSNRIGSSDFHEHGDNRIHIEGVVEKLQDISLRKFFEVVGGQLSQTYLRLPTNEGELIVQNGLTCPDGSKGRWQVFVYKTRNNLVTQEKLINFPDYVVSPYGTVPPGDCLIFEFGRGKNQTDNICKFYEIALRKGEIEFAK